MRGELIKRREKGLGDLIYWSDDKGNIYQSIGGNWVKLDDEQKVQLLATLMIISGKDLERIRADLCSPNIIDYTTQTEKEMEYFESLRKSIRPFWAPPPPPPAGAGCLAYLSYFVLSFFWAFLMFLFLKFIGNLIFK